MHKTAGTSSEFHDFTVPYPDKGAVQSNSHHITFTSLKNESQNYETP